MIKTIWSRLMCFLTGHRYNEIVEFRILSDGSWPWMVKCVDCGKTVLTQVARHSEEHKDGSAR